MSPASKVTNADNPFARAGKYNPFGGGGTKLGSLNDLDLQQLISQLQDQLDSDELKKKDKMNESYRKSSRRRNSNYRNRLNESSIISKVEEYSSELQDFAKRKGVPVDELKDGLKGLASGVVDMSDKVAKSVGEFLGVLVANKELDKSVVEKLGKNLQESIKRRKNVIKLSEGDLYKIVDRVLNEKKKDKNWIQPVEKEMEKDGTKGKFGDWCKKQPGKNWNGCSEDCIKKGKARGGIWAERAEFAETLCNFKK
jgi:hypothetical protein